MNYVIGNTIVNSTSDVRSTVTGFTGLASSGTSPSPIVRPPLPQPTGGWQLATYLGLRFKVALQEKHILAGQSRAGQRSEEEVLEIFRDFAGQYWTLSDLQHVLLPTRWPQVHGWVPQETVYANTSAPPSEITVEAKATAFGITNKYWTGVEFTQPTWVDEQYGRPAESAEDRLLRELHTLFASARDEAFEYGTPSAFAERLNSLLAASGRAGLEALKVLLFEGRRVPKEPALEALAVIGRSAGIGSFGDRLRFLLGFLQHPLASMRDSAGLALLDLGDKSAVGAIRAAAAKERHPQVRANLEDAANELDA